MVIADTSVWIPFFNRPDSHEKATPQSPHDGLGDRRSRTRPSMSRVQPRRALQKTSGITTLRAGLKLSINSRSHLNLSLNLFEPIPGSSPITSITALQSSIRRRRDYSATRA